MERPYSDILWPHPYPRAALLGSAYLPNPTPSKHLTNSFRGGRESPALVSCAQKTSHFLTSHSPSLSPSCLIC